MLFCLISLVGTAYDDSIDISTGDSNLQENSIIEENSVQDDYIEDNSPLNSNSNSNDMSNVVSNIDDTADDTSMDVVNGSSSKDKLGANKLAADHDLSGSTLQDIQNYLNSGQVAEGDTIYLGTGTWNSGNWDPYNGGPIQVSIPNLTIRGGTSDNPDGFASINAGSRIFQLNSPGITLSNIRFSNTDVQLVVL